MRRFVKYRSFRVFMFTFLSLSLIVGTITTSIHIREIQKEKALYRSNISDHTENITNHLAQNFDAIIATGNSIFASRWYMHFRNNANVYIDKFDVFKKMEIVSEIQTKVTALPFVCDVLVIIPSSDTVIHRRGWSTISSYGKIYGQVRIRLPESFRDAPIVVPADSSTCTITLDDPNLRREKGVISILIDRSSLRNTLEDIIPENVLYTHVDFDGQELYEMGEQTEDLIIDECKTKSQRLSVTIGYPKYDGTTIGRSRLMNFILMQTIVLILSIIAGIVITLLNLKPINEIVSNLGGSGYPVEDPYAFVNNYIAATSNTNAQLRAEKEQLRKSVNRFISIMEKEILFGMMTNPDFDFHDEDLLSSISWVNSGYPFILTILESKVLNQGGPIDILDCNELMDRVLYSYAFEIFSDNLCLLFWFRDSEDAKRAYATIDRVIKENFGNLYYYAVSKILYKPRDMHNAYLSLREKLSNQKITHHTLPISMEIELINNLQEGHVGRCASIIGEARAKYNSNVFFQMLVRVADEYGLESRSLREDYLQFSDKSSLDEQWDLIANYVVKLCKYINTYKNSQMNEFAELIRDYIDKNYCDPDLNIEKIANHFSVHRSSISKIFKDQFDTTYTDYVLGLRMGRATNLLKDTTMTIAKVGEMVGYRHYTTFKRAFIRHTEVSPKEFRGMIG